MVVILLLNVMVVFSVVAGALYGLPKSVYCACDPSVRLDIPSTCLVCVFCMFVSGVL